jgi:hypothetical protein
MTEASEFGGVGGLIQPLPHDVTKNAAESAMLERQVDPGDDQDSVQAVLARHQDGTYGRKPEPVVEVLPLQPDFMEAGVVVESNGFRVVGVGNIDMRTAQLKASSSPTMHPAVYGPAKDISPPSVAPVVDLRIASLAPGKWFYQVLMNSVQVTEVASVEVV